MFRFLLKFDCHSFNKINNSKYTFFKCKIFMSWTWVSKVLNMNIYGHLTTWLAWLKVFSLNLIYIKVVLNYELSEVASNSSTSIYFHTEVHPQLSHKGHPVDDVRVGAGSPLAARSWVSESGRSLERNNIFSSLLVANRPRDRGGCIDPGM
jgi:hypothetical protein